MPSMNVSMRFAVKYSMKKSRIFGRGYMKKENKKPKKIRQKIISMPKKHSLTEKKPLPLILRLPKKGRPPISKVPKKTSPPLPILIPILSSPKQHPLKKAKQVETVFPKKDASLALPLLPIAQQKKEEKPMTSQESPSNSQISISQVLKASKEARFAENLKRNAALNQKSIEKDLSYQKEKIDIVKKSENIIKKFIRIQR